MEIPQGAADGEEFDITARCKIEDGKMCVVSINGIPLKEESAEEKAEKLKNMKPSEAAMSGY